MTGIGDRLQLAMLGSVLLHAAAALAIFAARPPVGTKPGPALAPDSSRQPIRGPVRVQLLKRAAAGAEPATTGDSRGQPLGAVRPRAMRGRPGMNRPTAVLLPGDAEALATRRADPSAREAPGASKAQSSLGTDAALNGDTPRDSQGPTAIGSGVDPLGGPDNGQWLADLHQRLKDAAQKCYPPSARRLRLQGEADLVFALDEQGEARNVHLARSSGSSLLDRAATECVLRGALPAPGRPGEYGPVTIKFTEKR